MAELVGIAAAALALLATPAWADRIDGDWCADDGRHFTIDGPNIITPGGTQTNGDYSRHAFAYVVPDGEEDAGEPVAVVLLNEETVRVQIKDQPEIWLRCKPIV